jgi:endo-1,4-beta-xylanase
VIAWCRQHDLNINGHTLVWDNPRWQVPTWLPQDAGERARLLAKRIHELAARYGSVIQRWDVLNERLNSFRRPPHNADVLMPAGFDIAAFREAQAALPPEATLMINDYFDVWNPRQRAYHDLVRELEAQGARIDVIGLQCHSFSTDGALAVCRDLTSYTAPDLLASLDSLISLGRPLHVSEITVPQPADDAEGVAAQAEMVRNLYRLWFSHPGVNSITWWNLADGGAAPGEDHILSGLIDRQHQPKAAFTALDQLLNHEWKTRLPRLATDAAGQVRFRGFKGAYRVTVRTAGRETVLPATLAADGVVEVRLP